MTIFINRFRLNIELIQQLIVLIILNKMNLRKIIYLAIKLKRGSNPNLIILDFNLEFKMVECSRWISIRVWYI